MEILSPISRLDEVEPIIEAGANQIYCGVFSKEEKKKYTNMGCLNRYPCTPASLDSFSELKEVVKIAHAFNIPVMLTINDFYSERQYLSILEQIERAKDCDVDALIIADVGLLSLIRKQKLNNTKIHISTMGATFNSETANFYKELGASRIILPRQLTIEEIGAVARRAMGLELEIFILNRRARYIDGFCTFHPGVFGLGYSWSKQLSGLRKTKTGRTLARLLPYNISKILEKFPAEYACCLNYDIADSEDILNYKKKVEIKNFFSFFNLDAYLNGCGACSLYELDKLGITFVKIIGRVSTVKKKIKDVQFIKASINLLEEGLANEEFKKRIKELYQRIYLTKCNPWYCYYPLI